MLNEDDAFSSFAPWIREAAKKQTQAYAYRLMRRNPKNRNIPGGPDLVKKAVSSLVTHSIEERHLFDFGFESRQQDEDSEESEENDLIVHEKPSDEFQEQTTSRSLQEPFGPENIALPANLNISDDLIREIFEDVKHVEFSNARRKLNSGFARNDDFKALSMKPMESLAPILWRRIKIDVQSRAINTASLADLFWNFETTKESALNAMKSRNAKYILTKPPYKPGDDIKDEISEIQKAVEKCSALLIARLLDLKSRQPELRKQKIVEALEDAVYKSIVNINNVRSNFKEKFLSNAVKNNKCFTKVFNFIKMSIDITIKELYDNFERLASNLTKEFDETDEVQDYDVNRNSKPSKETTLLNQKIDFLSSKICSVFTANHPKSFGSMEDWLKVFGAHIDTLLRQLTLYFQSTSFNFNERFFREEFERILKKLYLSGKVSNIDSQGCHRIVKAQIEVKEELKKAIDMVKSLKDLMNVDKNENSTSPKTQKSPLKAQKTSPKHQKSPKKAQKSPSKPQIRFSPVLSSTILGQKPCENVKIPKILPKYFENAKTDEEVEFVTTAQQNPIFPEIALKPQKSPKRKLLSRLPLAAGSRQQIKKVAKEPILPFNYHDGMEIPKDVIERDILYVASQMTRQFPEDSTVQHNSLVNEIIKIAKKFENREITARKAIENVEQIISTFPCLPVDFYQTFIYHIKNENFAGIDFKEPEKNANIRAETINLRNQVRCDEAKIGPEIPKPVDPSEKDLEKLAKRVAESDKILDKEDTGTVLVIGFEQSRKNDDLLAVPAEINIEMAQDISIGHEKLSENLPLANVASTVMDQEIKEIEDRLKLPINQNPQSSRIENLNYVLRPDSLKTKTYWRTRGSSMPEWFPGFYTVYANSYDLTPVNLPSIAAAFLSAWVSMTPVKAT